MGSVSFLRNEKGNKLFFPTKLYLDERNSKFEEILKRPSSRFSNSINFLIELLEILCDEPFKELRLISPNIDQYLRIFACYKKMNILV